MTFLRLGTVATGLVQMIQQALILPAIMLSNMEMVPPLASVRRVPWGISHSCSMKLRSASDTRERCPGRPGPM
ncbi:hypothetical protein D3C75_1197540 [compost metagenome]